MMQSLDGKMILDGLKISTSLEGKTAVVTGGGGGIGLEAARCFLELGANVIIAEIDEAKCRTSERELSDLFGKTRIHSIRVDIGDESQVQQLKKTSIDYFGTVDIVLNNATVAPLGTVLEVPIKDWDRSYHVNLRGPVLTAKSFIPDMVSRNEGVFINVSSTGTAYLGAYETFKSAQVHLTETLDAEFESTGVICFTIGPGLVLTDTAKESVEKIAPLMGLSVGEFYENNRNALLSVEEAGAGFALSAVYADKYRGMEISSMQVLLDAGYTPANQPQKEGQTIKLNKEKRELAAGLTGKVQQTLTEQADGWRERSLFERQWMLRDFRKHAGMPVEQWLSSLEELESSIISGKSAVDFDKFPLSKLSDYYAHMAELAKSYEKDPEKLADSLRHIRNWQEDVDDLIRVISG